MPIAPRVILTSLLAGLAVGFQEARDSITAEEIRGHLFLLSSDRLEGRAPGTRGGDIAAEYIAARFIASGLEPVDGLHFQDVPVVATTVDSSTASLVFQAGDARIAADYRSQAVFWPGDRQPTVQLDGELVFVGFGIRAPEWSWDDFKGRDLTGKILLCLVGDPPAPPDEAGLFDGPALTYYGRWSYKLEEARRRGASGALIVHRTDAAGYGWNVVASSWGGSRHTLVGPAAEPQTPLQGWIAEALAREILAQAGLDLDELTARAARRDFRPLSTGITVRARMDSRTRSVATRNVVGFLPGADPTVGDETLIFVAHYDHLGIGPAVDGDSIYNGAYDNASGVSILLELADAFARLDVRDRGILFLATTEEEAGLLGARHYVRQPLLPLERTVAAINIDGANLWGETDDAIVLGARFSTLGRIARGRAAELGLELRPDPAPGKGGLFRSDHFPFARAGIPILAIQHGLEFRDRPPRWGERLMTEWERDRYHQPSDELDADADLSGAVQQARLLFGVGYDVIMGQPAPTWYGPPPFASLPP